MNQVKKNQKKKTLKGSKYTPERIEAILSALRLGTPRKHSAQASGINEATFHEWMKNQEFSDKVQAAEADFIINNLKVIEAASEKGNWQASAWKLERRQKEDFALRQDIKHSGQLGILDEIRKAQKEATGEK